MSEGSFSHVVPQRYPEIMTVVNQVMRLYIPCFGKKKKSCLAVKVATPDN